MARSFPMKRALKSFIWSGRRGFVEFAGEDGDASS